MEFPNPIVEDLLLHFKSEMGDDYEKYKNHVYRVFLNCLLRDSHDENLKKYAIAAVFHDIGIWTDHTIDYLDPSIAQMKIYLQNTGEEELTDEISAMIDFHHKITSYNGPFRETVEHFRKADWTDVSLGLLTFGSDRRQVALNRARLPNAGFHLFLIRKILFNFLKHPLNPLPMFKG